MRETKFQKAVKEQLESQGAWILNIHGHAMQKAGIPDLHVVHRKWSGYLELKCEKREATELQKEIGRKIIARWYPCYVLRCVETTSGANFTYSEDTSYTSYTIEEFNGEIILEFADLRELLDHLIELRWIENEETQE